MEVTVQDEVTTTEPEGLAAHAPHADSVDNPVAQAWASDDATSKKKRTKRATKSSASTGYVSEGAKPKEAPERTKHRLGDATRASSAPHGLEHQADASSSGSQSPAQGGSAPLPAVPQEGERPLGRRNSHPGASERQESKKLRIPLFGRLRLDIKFNHEVVPKEPKPEHQPDKHSSKKKGSKKSDDEHSAEDSSASPVAEKESQLHTKAHDTHETSHHHGPFHFFSNLFHHHHHHYHHEDKLSQPQAAPAPKVEVVA